MNDPDPNFEKKALQNVIEQMTNVGETIHNQLTLKKLLFGVGTAGLLFAFLLAIATHVHPLTIALLAGAAGVVIGFGLSLNFVYKQWAVTCRHIDMHSVHKRLEELED